MIKIHLQKFEGPLDLLLYLIRKDEMDIFDIKIHEITSQYMEYIKMLKELDLEVAGDFIAMASTLIHIKSRMLLPQYNDQGELVEVEDPRKELVQRLIEYQKYQEAAKKLVALPWVGRDVYLRGEREVIKPEDGEITLEENALFALISSYRAVIRAFHKKIHKVSKNTQSIAQRILEIKEYLHQGVRAAMSTMITAIENRERQILITFLSLLELGKMGYVTLYQADVYGEIYVDTKNEIQTDVISRVEEFDGMRAQEAAEHLFAEAEEQRIADEPLVDLQASNELSFGDSNENQNLDLLTTAVATNEEMASDEEILAAELELEQELAQEITQQIEQNIDLNNANEGADV